MNKSKAQREFVVVTLIALISIALIIAVYATLLGTYTGGDIEVVTLGGTIYYSQDNSTWATTLTDVGNATTWYARLNLTSGGPAGDVTVYWWLQRNAANMTTPVEQTTSWALSGNAEAIYASSTGVSTGNYNWGQNCTLSGTYRVMAKVVV